MLRYRGRGTHDARDITCDWLVNCTGVERAGIAHSPLLREMMRQGLIKADPLQLGIGVDEASRVVGGNPGSVPMHAVGALTAGQFWEITAVPDIRAQARAVARRISDSIAG
jgi:uncharacterized NAD(P)/FAD-binding protein YdhS